MFEDGSILSLILLFLAFLGMNGFFFYRLRSIKGFVLFALAVLIVFGSLFLSAWAYDREFERAYGDVLTDTAFLIAFVLVIGSVFVGVRDYYESKGSFRSEF